MKKDYYEILGVPKESSLQDIKKAYRSLALTHHPDRVPQEKKKEAEEKFKEISEAYGVLSDPEKRRLYDQHGHQGIDQNYTSEDIFRGANFNFEGMDLGDIVSRMFGEEFDVFGGGGGRRGGQRQRRGRDIQYETELNLEEAYNGLKKTIKVPRYEPCKSCEGSGAKNGKSFKTCSTCKGQGQVVMSSGFFRMAQTCGQCRGTGQQVTEHCPDCRGQGSIKVVRDIDVSIPAGVDNDSQLRVRGEGEVGSGGPGDLYIFIKVNTHPVFTREGNDLHMDLPISFVKAALGADANVQTLNGSIDMKIPAGTQSGKIFRVRGKGMPDVHGRGQGDLYVRVMIEVPTKLTTEQRNLLEEFARLSGETESNSGSFKERIKKVFK